MMEAKEGRVSFAVWLRVGDTWDEQAFPCRPYYPPPAHPVRFVLKEPPSLTLPGGTLPKALVHDPTLDHSRAQEGVKGRGKHIPSHPTGRNKIWS